MFKPIQKLWKRVFRKIKKFRKDNSSNLNTIIVCISVIAIWKWVWDLMEIYVFPQNPLLSNIVCIILWVAVLLVDDGKLEELQEK